MEPRGVQRSRTTRDACICIHTRPSREYGQDRVPARDVATLTCGAGVRQGFRLTRDVPVCHSSFQVPSEPVNPPARAVRLAIDPRRFTWNRKLASDYANAFARLAPFFAGDPSTSDAWRTAVTTRHDWPRRNLSIADVVRRQQRQRDAPEAARRSADRLADPRTVAVVTGQQAGLFGGPIYTLLKATTTIALASRVTGEYGARAVPVFWVHAEDHDWDEIGSCTILTEDFDCRTVAVTPPRQAGHVPAAALRFDRSVEDALKEVEATLASTEFTHELLAQLLAIYRADASVTGTFARWLETIFGPQGLVVFDSSDPDAKQLARDVFRQELGAPGRTAELARRTGERLEALGYHAQVTPQPDSVALFHLNGGREPIRRRNGSFLIGTRERAADELMAEAAASPERFSPNVLLRPVVQDALFPTICCVAGPSELAYLAQLRDVYELFQVPMPLVHPRASATIVDAAAARFLSRYDLPFEELQSQDEAALNRLLESLLPPAVDRALDAASDAIRTRMEEVVAAVPAVDPTLEGAARSSLGKMQHDFGTLRNKVIQASKRRHDVLRRQFTRARAQAFPGGQPQERAISFIFLLNQYGPGIVERLIEELPFETHEHWVVTV